MTRPAHDPSRCYWCGASDALQDLRPFGPAGANVCLPCVTDPAHPERDAAAAELFAQAQTARPPAGVTELRPSVPEVRFGG